MNKLDRTLLSYLHEHYENLGCALHFSNDLECLVAIILSAQTTDIAVNKITPSLFKTFKEAKDYMEADIKDIEDKIHSIGLYHNKAKNLKALGEVLYKEYEGKVPHSYKLLTLLPGVGSKTAGVFLLERANILSIPVDTHLSRVAKRLNYASKNDKPLQIGAKLEKRFPKEEWKFLHHSLIWFGRNECHAIKPDCSRCKLKEYCSYFKNTSSTTFK